MGGIDALTARLGQIDLIGLDTMIFIYAFECHPDYGPLAKAVFRALEEGLCYGCASVLALGEVLTGAKKAQNTELLSRYRDVFQRFPGLNVADVDKVVMERMADLRVCHGIPTPDAIHLGTALVYGAGAFVTNDIRLRKVTEIEVLVLSEFVGEDIS
jgi:predicted nucleic acid-binding protein